MNNMDYPVVVIGKVANRQSKQKNAKESLEVVAEGSGLVLFIVKNMFVMFKIFQESYTSCILCPGYFIISCMTDPMKQNSSYLF